MTMVSKKLRRGPDRYEWYCAACSDYHQLKDGCQFDGCVESPTFWPAFRHEYFQDESFGYSPMNKEKIHRICQYHIVGGRVQYSSLSTHLYAGQTVEMPNLPEAYRA